MGFFFTLHPPIKNKSMSGIINLLGGDLGKSLIEGLSSQTGQSKSNTSNLLNMAMPVLMQAMQRNAATPKGASGLLGALTEKHDGSILNDLGAIISGSAGTAKEKMDALEAAGVRVVVSPAEIGKAVKEVLS